MKIDPYFQRRNCSPLDVLSGGAKMTLAAQGVPPMGASNKGRVGKQAIFELSVSISKTVVTMDVSLIFFEILTHLARK